MVENIFRDIPKIKYSEEAATVSSEEFRKVVESRRSVRVYDKTPIPEGVMNQCLDLALLAPNSSNLQPWEFYWVKSPDKKAALVEACFSQPAARTAAELIVAVGRTKTWEKHRLQMLEALGAQDSKVPTSAISYYEKLVPLAYTMGPFGVLGYLKKVLFFFTGFFRATPREPSSLSDMKIWASKSTALACENLMLALRAHGYDSCPMEGLDSVRVRKILQLPRDAFVVMAISAGKRDSNGVYGPRLRFHREQFIKEV